jgi:hypothetical protein
MSNGPALKMWIVVALLAAAGVHAAEPAAPPGQPVPSRDSDPFPLSVRVSPTVVMAGQAAGAGGLNIAGETLPAGQRPLVGTIVSEAGAVVSTHQTKPDAQGRYTLAAPVPAQPGNYRIDVVAPDGRGKASGRFQVVGPSTVGPKAGSVLEEALAAAEAGLDAAEAKIDALSDSPAKTQAKKQIADAKRGLADVRKLAVGNTVRGIIGAISSDAAAQEAMASSMGTLGPLITDTASETERVRALTAEMSKADIGCQQLVAVTEVFKAAGAVMAVKGRLVVAAGTLAKQYIDLSYARRTKTPVPAPDPAAGPSLMTRYQAEVDVATKVVGGVIPVLNALSGYVSAKVFGAYCEQFVGPIEGIMNARFFTPMGKSKLPTEWWSYNYRITGRLILYYPKQTSGETVRLNGRIEGYAHGFKTWEDALTVMFPGLMAGAVQHKFNYPPIEMGNLLANPTTPGVGPGSGYTKDAVGSLALPNSFLLSATGVLEKDSMTVLIGPAQSDIHANHRVGVLIVSPLSASLGPSLTWYPLPFQKVRNFLVNAADGESMKLKLKTTGELMQAEGVFSGKVDKPKGKAEYTLKVKACNPGC